MIRGLIVLIGLLSSLPAFAVTSVGNGNTSCSVIGSGTFANRPLTGVSVCSQYWATDLGTGVMLSWNGTNWKPATGSAIIAQSGSITPVTGVNAETAVISIPIPAGLLSANGSLRLTPLEALTTTATNTFHARFSATGCTAGSACSSGTAYAATALTTSPSYRTQIQVTNTGSVSAQVGANGGSGAFSVGAGAVTTSAINTAAQTFFNIDTTPGNTTDTTTLEYYTLEWLEP